MNPSVLMPFLIEIIISLLFFISIGFYLWINHELLKYKGQIEANKMFGAFMINHPKRYTISFFGMSIAAVTIFPTSVLNIASFFYPSLSTLAVLVFRILSMISIIANVGFFITFVLMGAGYWRSYIKKIKSNNTSASNVNTNGINK